jgi:CMP/dCMP kinase
MRKQPVIAVDGPSGVGKSTAAKEIAKRLGYMLVDTGALYRTAALLADEAGVSWESPEKIVPLVEAHTFAFDEYGSLLLDGKAVGEKIRTPRISMGASAIAKHSAVRQALLGLQRKLGQDGGIVLEGRDVGTVVFPDAEIKIFLSASAEVRARRRFLELNAKGRPVSFKEVFEDQKARDRADSTRSVAPLKQARDAVLVNCDEMTASQTAEEMLRIIRRQSRSAAGESDV